MGINKVTTEKSESLQYGPTTTFITDSDGIEPLTIRINKSFMSMKGYIEIETEAELEELNKFILMCWTEHRKLAPKIYTSFAGH